MIHQNGLRDSLGNRDVWSRAPAAAPSWKRLRFQGWTRAAAAQYTSGIRCPMIDGNGGWSLGFAHENWKFTQGQPSPADADL